MQDITASRSRASVGTNASVAGRSSAPSDSLVTVPGDLGPNLTGEAAPYCKRRDGKLGDRVCVLGSFCQDRRSAITRNLVAHLWRNAVEPIVPATAVVKKRHDQRA